MNEIGACLHELRIAAVHVAARGTKVRAQVLAPRLAKLASSARGRDPRDANALSRGFAVHDLAHHLMSEHDRKPRTHPPLDLVQLGVTDRATRHANQNLAGINFRLEQVFQRKGSWVLRERRGLAQEHGFHCGRKKQGGM